MELGLTMEPMTMKQQQTKLTCPECGSAEADC